MKLSQMFVGLELSIYPTDLGGRSSIDFNRDIAVVTAIS